MHPVCLFPHVWLRIWSAKILALSLASGRAGAGNMTLGSSSPFFKLAGLSRRMQIHCGLGLCLLRMGSFARTDSFLFHAYGLVACLVSCSVFVTG